MQVSGKAVFVVSVEGILRMYADLVPLPKTMCATAGSICKTHSLREECGGKCHVPFLTVSKMMRLRGVMILPLVDERRTLNL